MGSWCKLLLLLCFPLQPCFSQYKSLSGHQLWKLEGDVDHVASRLLVDGLADVFGHAGPMRTIRVKPEDAKEVEGTLCKEGIAHNVLIEDLATYLETKNKKRFKRKTESCKSKSCPQPLLNSYMTFDEIEWYLKELNSSYSSIVKVTSIGKSHEGRDIWQVFIKASNCNQGNAVWLEGGIHAREWISPAVTLHLIDRLVKECSAGKLLDMYVVPVANPDGYVYSWTNDRLWRKNKNKNTNSKCYGVDLNRNWDYEYGVGASTNPCSEIYKGTAPFSEPETIALKTAMHKVSQAKKLLMVIAIHSYGQDLMYPWGGVMANASNSPELIEKGNKFARAAKKINGKVYGVVNSATAYGLIGGSTDDWSKAALKVRYTYTLELRDTGKESFELAEEYIAPSANEIWAGMGALLLAINPSKCSLL